MATHELFYATNRKHQGADRWHPTGYGTRFSDDGLENLRFGKLTLDADDAAVNAFLADSGAFGVGDGIGLSNYLSERAATAEITAYPEKDLANRQGKQLLGSKAMFADLQALMAQASDVVVYIHGFNVKWSEAVGAALALQIRLNTTGARDAAQSVRVVLFSWPSDGLALPYLSYKSDRTEAVASGKAFARGVLKVRDFLIEICPRGSSVNPCRQDIHLLCHSMGNYVLQHALPRIADYASGRALPRVFEQIFMCSPDVNADGFEDGQPLARLPELCRSIAVYYNRGDKSMYVSDYTKGNPERLGGNGAARPALLNAKVQTVDCTPIVEEEGLVEHSYYLDGHVTDDIRQSCDGVAADSKSRRRRKKGDWPNLWEMK